MRPLIASFMFLASVSFVAFATAGSFTVTTTPAQDEQLKALKVTPQQIVTQRLDGAARAEENRKLAQLRQACTKGDKAACTAISTATKAVK